MVRPAAKRSGLGSKQEAAAARDDCPPLEDTTELDAVLTDMTQRSATVEQRLFSFQLGHNEPEVFMAWTDMSTNTPRVAQVLSADADTHAALMQDLRDATAIPRDSTTIVGRASAPARA